MLRLHDASCWSSFVHNVVERLQVVEQSVSYHPVSPRRTACTAMIALRYALREMELLPQATCCPATEQLY